MPKPIVYILDPYHPDAVTALQNNPSIDVVLKNDPRRDNWHADATGLMIRSETRITPTDLAQAKKLKVIVKQGVGVDNIDLSSAKDHGVVVCNTPALNSESVAELTLTLALSIARRISEVDRRVRRGEMVVRSQTLGQSLYQKAIGIIGMGNIGKVVARKWIGAMDGRIVAYDPFAAPDAWTDIPHRRVQALEELLDVSDVVSLHVPLTDSTRSMIGKPQFERMKNNAILLNCARGGIVDEAALTDALTTKKIYGAALDAMDVEPPTIEAYEELLQNQNLIMTPHIGASTMENQIKSGLAVVETLIAVLEGEDVPNRVF
ncbi:putative D-3-phosphoglycerate dehydrogenase [Viridothelium virens]|uniref:Putative D-3-phosphoglycerate dehydrogenase n=1 Tax=Viridothelium virens TaxID=1048519 RepID=A0A6A6HEH5_VIRVR|nr:putative D-3-phosphoglycerate dehydrogenase [Viridothelium virens]